jgi:sortase B
MGQGKYQKKKKRAPLWYYAALIILLGVFIGCIWYLGSYFLGSRQQAGEFEDLAAMVEAARGTAPEREPDAQPGGNPLPDDGDFEMMVTEPEDHLRNEQGILYEYEELYAMNPDLGGWLYIEGTKINYPVMHTPGRPDYYLRRNFNGESSSWGCLYAREECDLEEPSDNVTIYGHHMKDGSMFAGLSSYTSREFWENHRYIHFDTIRSHHVYEIFAVFKTTASKGQGFAYHDFINAADEQDFDTFIAKCLSMSFYGTDLVPEYGDKIICLSTCEYTQTNGRLVVAAVRIN